VTCKEFHYKDGHPPCLRHLCCQLGVVRILIRASHVFFGCAPSARRERIATFATWTTQTKRPADLEGECVSGSGRQLAQRARNQTKSTGRLLSKKYMNHCRLVSFHRGLCLGGRRGMLHNPSRSIGVCHVLSVESHQASTFPRCGHPASGDFG